MTNDELLRKHLATIGRRGGAVKSDEKAANARANGKKGGRPRKIPPPQSNTGESNGNAQR